MMQDVNTQNAAVVEFHKGFFDSLKERERQKTTICKFLLTVSSEVTLLA